MDTDNIFYTINSIDLDSFLITLSSNIFHILPVIISIIGIRILYSFITKSLKRS